MEERIVKINIEIDVELNADGTISIWNQNGEVLHEISRRSLLNQMFKNLPHQEWLSVKDARDFANEILRRCDKYDSR